MNDLLNKIEKYLERDDIRKDSSTISLYELYKILEYKFEPLKDLKYKSDTLKNKITNESFPNAGPLRSIYPYKFCDIYACPKTNERQQGIEILARNYYSSHEFIIIRDEQGLMCDSNRNHKIIKKYNDELNEIFDGLENYDFTKDEMSQEFSCNFFNIKISYRTDGIINLDIKEEPSQNIYILHWTTFDSFIIKDLLWSTSLNLPIKIEEALLRKIPVNISDLNKTLKPMVQDYLSMNNAPVLVKKKKFEIPPNIDLSSLG